MRKFNKRNNSFKVCFPFTRREVASSKTPRNDHAFTLLELMVVITIIAVLAGFSMPAISGALDRSNQTKDLNNAKQLAQILFMEANENNGLFRRNEALDATNQASSSTAVFKGLMKDRVLSSCDVISGFATQPFQGGTNYDAMTADNVSWAYFAGLTTADDDKLPLLITKGNTDIITKAVLTGSYTNVTLSGSPAWGKKGVIIAYKGQNAEFKKAKNGVIKLGADTDASDSAAALLQP